MTNKMISELTELATQPADGDLFPIVDVSDTTDASSGTTKKITYDVMIPDASATVYGKSKLSTAPASATDPIAVGDNDTRVPSQGENDALVGTSGTPSTSNPYATKATTDLLATTASVTSALGFKTYTVGALDNALVKTYFNIQLPFILWTGSTNGATTTDFPNWIRNNGNPVATYLGAFCDFQTGGGVASSIYLDLFYGGAGTRFIRFNGTNKIILDWWAKLPATATGDVQMGFCSEEGALREVYNSSGTGARVTISQHGTDGKIYAHINEEGVGHTETEITGVTVTNYNNYRIELDLGTDAKFYVNGVLQYTYSGANLETDAITLALGFGRSGTAQFIVTAPTLSLELNP